ncbi:QacE family quaternary ammonium compound efflux SMR transporter [Brevibacillus fluminis]|uniref:QacE family quaternary ammonium compound efflux SMR transporter n=1 Tax=Brevibacillus fluminis TaxID=511487 RepID=A0A3M8DBN1_9BACL|nr:multidrug efflux SMR transporter [Brevibacillus fluminis]RNB85029.1 QacE family quaternary ammonium compound efflux SMR transporter [Brevibacillus fluminis]
MNYLFLLLAILTEIVATTSLKLSDGFTRLVPSIVVVIGYAVSFYLLSLALRGLPLGTAYAIWSGLGTALTVVVGIILWQESISPLRIIGILTIIAGVVLLKLADSPATQTMSQ